VRKETLAIKSVSEGDHIYVPGLGPAVVVQAPAESSYSDVVLKFFLTGDRATVALPTLRGLRARALISSYKARSLLASLPWKSPVALTDRTPLLVP